MEKILLGYGPLQVEAAFDGAKSVTCLEPAAEPAIENGKAAFYEAVRHPVDSDPLDRVVSSEDQVTIIISDITRFWSRQDLICRELVAFLHQECSMPYENMAVLVALGTHRGQSEEELRRIASEEVYQKVKMVCHDCEGALSYLGDTSFGTPVWVNPLAVGRKVITIGATVHHLMSGYGGGRKSILPGISGKRRARLEFPLTAVPIPLWNREDLPPSPSAIPRLAPSLRIWRWNTSAARRSKISHRLSSRLPT